MFGLGRSSLKNYSKLAAHGSCNWKKTDEKLKQHKLSNNHVDAIIYFSNREREIYSVDRALP